MASAGSRRNRTASINSVAKSRNNSLLGRLYEILQTGPFWARIGLSLLAMLAVWAGTFSWQPPFPYRERAVLSGPVYARVDFKVLDIQKTNDARNRAKKSVLARYELDQGPLENIKDRLKENLFGIMQAESFEKLDPKIWQPFLSKEEKVSTEEQKKQFELLQKDLKKDPKMVALMTAVQDACNSIGRNGLLQKLQHGSDASYGFSINQIWVYLKDPNLGQAKDVDECRIPLVMDKLRKSLKTKLEKAEGPIDSRGLIARLVFQWFENQGLPTTLTFRPEISISQADLVAGQVKDQYKTYRAGDEIFSKNLMETGSSSLISTQGGDTNTSIQAPLTDADILLLKQEHNHFVANWSYGTMFHYGFARYGLFVAVLSLCGIYLFYENQKWLFQWRSFLTLLLLFCAACLCSFWLWYAPIRAELVPMAIFSMTIAIMFHSELALLLSSVVSLVMVFSLGLGLPEFVTMVSLVTITCFQSKKVDTRTRLIFVGLFAAAIAVPTAIYVKVALGWGMSSNLIWESLWVGLQVVFAGVAMTALLPFLERFFDFHTDISLLELGVPTHPLLRELLQQAPGTYNHSINVASLAETAAIAIGANGVLVRVGAYFHDIGKICKPEYFIENQNHGENKHNHLEPTVSTLVIVGHVKDGAELARKYRLPNSIIDFILQHHGTTLVEYFYRVAKSEEDPETSVVQEAEFRYPGPKPQTREAAVMMLADAVESCSRSLQDPAPKRLERIVEEMTQKRLADGQFDECGLTLKELHIVKESLVKSLNAMYHGRIKYPGQAAG